MSTAGGAAGRGGCTMYQGLLDRLTRRESKPRCGRWKEGWWHEAAAGRVHDGAAGCWRRWRCLTSCTMLSSSSSVANTPVPAHLARPHPCEVLVRCMARHQHARGAHLGGGMEHTSQ